MPDNKRGFAKLDVATRQEIARKGGKAAHEKGTGHEWTSEEARAAGQKGGSRRSKKTQQEAVDGQPTGAS